MRSREVRREGRSHRWIPISRRRREHAIIGESAENDFAVIFQGLLFQKNVKDVFLGSYRAEKFNSKEKLILLVGTSRQEI